MYICLSSSHSPVDMAGDSMGRASGLAEEGRRARSQEAGGGGEIYGGGVGGGSGVGGGEGGGGGGGEGDHESGDLFVNYVN